MINNIEKFDDFLDHYGVSGVSMTAEYSELAWNAAVDRMRDFVTAARDSGISDWWLTLHEELDNLDTGVRG